MFGASLFSGSKLGRKAVTVTSAGRILLRLSSSAPRHPELGSFLSTVTTNAGTYRHTEDTTYASKHYINCFDPFSGVTPDKTPQRCRPRWRR